MAPTTLTFKGVHIAVEYSPVGEPFIGQHVAWQEFRMTGQPAEIRLVFTTDDEEGTVAFPVFGGKRRRWFCGKYLRDLPVEWSGRVPKTRTRFDELAGKGKDNADIIRLWKLDTATPGAFLDVQGGLVTRKGRFFLVAQQVFRGLLGLNKASDEEWNFSPFPDAIHAYPGSSYELVWPEMAQEIAQVGYGQGSFKLSSEITPAEWNPPVVPRAQDWNRAVVLYWNLITQSGQIEDADTGECHYVSWRELTGPLKGLPMSALEPMTGVHYQLGQRERGGQGVVAVQPVS